MAEILLSLTIIGVVAAITLPSLTGNINERTWSTQRKALYARMSQAVALMPALNGYGTLTEGDSSTSAQDTATETFITDGLSKVLKINNICDNEHLEDCGIPSKITPLDGTSPIDISSISTLVNLNPMFNSAFTDSAGASYSFSQIDTKAAAFETQNGESILAYYSPNCIANLSETSYYVQKTVCANFIYDLNGSKGPNTVGKDIGAMTVFLPSDSIIVSPQPLLRNPSGTYKWVDASKACTAMDSESRLPNIEELSSLFVNNKLYKIPTGVAYWSGTVYSSTEAWIHGIYVGDRKIGTKDYNRPVRCVKRN